MTKTADKTLVNWMRLIRTPRVGPVTFWNLLSCYKTIENALDYLKSGQSTSFQIPSSVEIEEEIEKHHQKGIFLLPAYDIRFPPLLKILPDCPPILSVYGNCRIFQKNLVGVVGSRNASLMGRQFAYHLATDLGKEQWVVVSGLARGIDKYAHQGALKTGTIAVLAGGVDIIYPPEHNTLYKAIGEEGAVISEMPLSMHPGANHFPRRNRLISGLSKGVAVIEAAYKSGSLITAKFAIEQNREVFSVPGAPYDPRCQGTNELLKNGAHLLENAQDILTVLGVEKIFLEEPVYGYEANSTEDNLNSISRPQNSRWQEENIFPIDFSLKEKLLKDLSVTPLSVNSLVEQYACKPQDIMTILLEFELAGMVCRQSNGMVSRLYPVSS